MPERVDAAITRILHADPSVEVRFSAAITRDSYWLNGRHLYVHPSHFDTVDDTMNQPR